MNSTFDLVMPVTLGKTNATQNVYFAEYFSMQGFVREQWMMERVPNAKDILSSGLLLSTKSAHCDYKIPFFVFDSIICKMHIELLRRVYAKIVFEFFNAETNNLCATGWQVVVFKNSDRKTCRMPDEFSMAARKILWKSDFIY